ncbi:hypothetical protein [Bdellovibrio bacteriovorus]|uniref:hypothetical protein n=1 Tax=Bdellovibrio bacteriovorus TaxID=959 RepID=UPI0035A6917E
MKKVILAQTIVMTVLMGCSFSKDHEKAPEKNGAANIGTISKNSFQTMILEEDTTTLKDYIQSKSITELNTTFPDGSTALENAVLRGNSDVIRNLIQFGASPFVANKTTQRSIYQEVSILKIEGKTPSSIDRFKNEALSLGKGRAQSQIRKLLKSKAHDELLSFVSDYQVPASEVVEAIVRKSYKDFEIPLAVIEKLLKLPSMQNDDVFPFVVKRPSDLLLNEVSKQLNQVTPHFAFADFISAKLPGKLHGFQHYDKKEDRTYFVNPSLLLWWRNIKYTSRHEAFKPYIEKITRFPVEMAAYYCDGKCELIEEAKNSITIDQLQNSEKYWGNTILNDSLDNATGDFWYPEDEE